MPLSVFFFSPLVQHLILETTVLGAPGFGDVEHIFHHDSKLWLQFVYKFVFEAKITHKMNSKGNRKMTKDRRPVSRRVSESGEDLCPVCSEVVSVYAVGTCDHFVCYRCSTRMRSLCNQMYCAICRTELPKVCMISCQMMSATGRSKLVVSVFS